MNCDLVSVVVRYLPWREGVYLLDTCAAYRDCEPGWRQVLRRVPPMGYAVFGAVLERFHGLNDIMPRVLDRFPERIYGGHSVQCGKKFYGQTEEYEIIEIDMSTFTHRIVHTPERERGYLVAVTDTDVYVVRERMLFRHSLGRAASSRYDMPFNAGFNGARYFHELHFGNILFLKTVSADMIITVVKSWRFDIQAGKFYDFDRSWKIANFVEYAGDLYGLHPMRAGQYKAQRYNSRFELVEERNVHQLVGTPVLDIHRGKVELVDYPPPYLNLFVREDNVGGFVVFDPEHWIIRKIIRNTWVYLDQMPLSRGKLLTAQGRVVNLANNEVLADTTTFAYPLYNGWLIPGNAGCIFVSRVEHETRVNLLRYRGLSLVEFEL